MAAYDALNNQQGYNQQMMQQQQIMQNYSGMLGGQLGISGYANSAGCFSGTIIAQLPPQISVLRTAVAWLDSELDRVRIKL